MKLIQFRTPGPVSMLECLDVSIPEPRSDEVLIRAHAIGVGMPDVLIRASTNALNCSRTSSLAACWPSAPPAIRSRNQPANGSIGSYCGQGICDLPPGAPETHGISGMALKRPSAPPPQGPLARNSFAEPHLDFRIERSIDRTT
jgi:hypothetical protein